MASFITPNDTTLRLQDGITMESSNIAALQIPGLSKQARQIHIYPKIKTAPLLSLGVLCDNGFTITLQKQDISVQNNGQEIMKGSRNKQTGMWEVPMKIQQSEAVKNKIRDQTSKTELAHFLHAALFSPQQKDSSRQSNKVS